MKYVKSITTLLLMLLFVFPAASQAGSGLADPDDIFFLISPAPNATISGTTAVSWRVYDDEQTVLPYEINLLDSTSCSTHIGTIAGGMISSNSSKDSTVSFSSSGPLTDISSIPDGKYCLQVCHSFVNAGEPYSSCNLRGITIRNHNTAPTITTTPPGDRTITTNDDWSYDMGAIDSEGDAISYSLFSAPNFISIDPNSGLIQTNGSPKIEGEFKILVVAQDNYGGNDTQAFTLTVQNESTSQPNKNESATINILFPTSDSEFSGDSNQVVWDASDSEGISKITLLYSQDQKTWRQLASLGAKDKIYKWDVTNLESGKYYLQIIVQDNEGVSTVANSDGFSISNSQVKSEQSFVTKPLVINLSPVEGSSISSSRPIVSGEFTPPIDGKIEPSSFRFFIDSVDAIESCEVSERAFSCTLETDLDSGSHKARVEIKSADGKSTVKEWTFIVDLESDTQVTLPGEVISPGFGAVLLISCLILLLISIPIVIFIIWRNRDSRIPGTTSVEVKPEPDTHPPVAEKPSIANLVSPPRMGHLVPKSVTGKTEQVTQTTAHPDPADFDSYEEYVAAAEANRPSVGKEPEATKEADESSGKSESKRKGKKQAEASVDVNVPDISTPSYVDVDVEPDPVDTAEEAFAPGWLNAVPGTEPQTDTTIDISASVPDPKFAEPDSNKDDEAGFGYGK